MDIMFNYISLVIDIIHSYMTGFDSFLECKTICVTTKEININNPMLMNHT